MKRVLSICLVCFVLLSLSVTCFAADNYSPKTVNLIYDPDTYTFSVPNGVEVYVGDTIVFDYLKCNIVESTEYVDECITIFPGDCAIYIDGVEVGGFWYSGTVVFNNVAFKSLESTYKRDNGSLEKPGHVSIGVKQWHCDSKIGNEEFIDKNSLPYPMIIEFELKDPAARYGSKYFGFFGGLVSMIGELAKTIIRYPLMLCFVVLSLVGLGIGLFVRAKQ